MGYSRIGGIFSFVYVLFSPLVLLAQSQPQLIADLNTNLTSFSCSATTIRGLTNTAVSVGKSFFSCTSTDTGSELWVSDGTQAGTKLVKETTPGAASGIPSSITATNAVGTPLVFFSATSPDNGLELWRSDGTPEGTSLVADIVPGVGTSAPRIIGAFGNEGIIFSADNSTIGRELYYADRTTFRGLGDLYPGPFSGISNSTSGVFLPTTGRFYFSGSDVANGNEVFKTDGFTISLEQNIRAGVAGSQPNNFTLAPNGDAVYFTASNGIVGNELWRLNGTTVALAGDLNSGSVSSNPSNLVVTTPETPADRRLVFSATTTADGDRLYFLNQSTGGIGAVGQIVPGGVGDKISTVVVSGSNVFFQATSPTSGKELYSFNPISGVLSLVSDFTPGVGSSVLSEFAPIEGSSLLVRAYNPSSTEEEYYVTSGGPNSLTLLRDINPGPLGSGVVYLGGPNSYKIFQALTGDDTNLWRTNGTFGGTFAFKDLSVPGGSKSSTPFYKLLLGGKLLHDANSSTAGSEPQIVDLVGGNNFVIKDIALGNTQSSFPGPFYKYGDKAIFAAISYTQGYEPFITDGTVEGTQLLGDFCTDPNYLLPPFILVVNDKIVVLSPDAAEPLGYALFVSSGVPGNFVKVTGVGGLYPSISVSGTQPVALGNFVLFSGGDLSTGSELQRLDLSNNSITLLGDFYAGELSGAPGAMVIIDSRVYFGITVAAPVAREIGVSDGTIAGTFLLGDIETTPGVGSSPQDFVKVGSSVLFAAVTSSGGRELYRTNGSPGNVELVQDINPSGSGISSLAERSTILGGVMYFSGSDGAHGFELWRTDGTAAGTFMVKDINPGAVSSTPNYMVEVDGFIYFAANHVDYGVELWRSDGTEAGTVLMSDFAPGPLSGNPIKPLVVGGTLLLGITDGITGNELYRWTVDECLGSIKFSPGVCGCSVADTDTNANGIFDCKQGAELKALLSGVSANLRTLSSKRLKVNKRKAVLRSLKVNVDLAVSYGTAGAAGISVSSSVPLPKLLLNMSKSVRGLVKRFSAMKLAVAKRSFNKVNSAIVA